MANKTRRVRLLDGVTATGAGSAFGMLGPASIHLEGLVSGDVVLIQASNDAGSNYITIATVTADSILTTDQHEKIRANFSDNSGGGTITVNMFH